MCRENHVRRINKRSISDNDNSTAKYKIGMGWGVGVSNDSQIISIHTPKELITLSFLIRNNFY